MFLKDTSCTQVFEHVKGYARSIMGKRRIRREHVLRFFNLVIGTTILGTSGTVTQLCFLGSLDLLELKNRLFL